MPLAPTPKLPKVRKDAPLQYESTKPPQTPPKTLCPDGPTAKKLQPCTPLKHNALEAVTCAQRQLAAGWSRTENNLCLHPNHYQGDSPQRNLNCYHDIGLDPQQSETQ